MCMWEDLATGFQLKHEPNGPWEKGGEGKEGGRRMGESFIWNVRVNKWCSKR